MTEVPPGASPVDRLRVGDRVREWRVERFVARGAFGQVFEAARDSWQSEPTRALKVFDPILSSQARSALVTEFDVLRHVRHPHVLAGEDAFDIDDGPLAGCVVFVLELAQTDLGSVLARGGPLPADQVAAIGMQLASGLAALHESGHLHGDVKPENALFANGHWKLGDFGVSAALQGSYARPTGATLDYRPPEVVAETGDGRVHRSADVWALGATLWVAATGQHPFVGADPTVRHAAIIRNDRRPAPGFADPLADVLDRRFLHPDPHARISAAEAMTQLQALGGSTDDVAPPVPTATIDGGAMSSGEATVPDPVQVRTQAAPTRRPGIAVTDDSSAEPVESVRSGIGDATRPVAAVVAVGGLVGGVTAEIASLLAAAGPGSLAVRRSLYVVLLVGALVALGTLARRRLDLAPARLAAGTVAALVVAALVTGYLFALA